MEVTDLDVGTVHEGTVLSLCTAHSNSSMNTASCLIVTAVSSVCVYEGGREREREREGGREERERDSYLRVSLYVTLTHTYVGWSFMASSCVDTGCGPEPAIPVS